MQLTQAPHHSLWLSDFLFSLLFWGTCSSFELIFPSLFKHKNPVLVYYWCTQHVVCKALFSKHHILFEQSVNRAVECFITGEWDQKAKLDWVRFVYFWRFFFFNFIIIFFFLALFVSYSGFKKQRYNLWHLSIMIQTMCWVIYGCQVIYNKHCRI